MANTNSPFGMRPVKEANGSPWSATQSLYYVSADDSTALYIGDPVIIAGDSDANGVSTVTRATGGTSARITGTVVGFGVTPALVANGAVRTASVAGYVLVADGPGVTYEVQEDSAGGALTAASVGLNANLASGTGNLIQGSTFVLDSSTASTSNTGQVRILGLAQRPNNVIGNYAVWNVRINLPTEAGTASGTGV